MNSPPKNIPSSTATKTFGPGTTLFKEGQKAHEMYVLIEGEIVLSVREKNKEKKLATLRSGAILGEMALLDGEPRSATATTSKPTKVILINEHNFQALCKQLPLWLLSILRVVSSRLRDTNASLGKPTLTEVTKGVAYWILKKIESKQPTEFPNEINFYEFHEEMVFNSGISKEKIGASLSELKEKGLIDSEMREGNRYITVPDTHRLRHFFNEP